MPELDVIAWPYHAGVADVSMGLGASVLAADERFRERLRAAGWQTRLVRVLLVDETLGEVARTFEVTEARPSTRATPRRRYKDRHCFRVHARARVGA